MVERIEHSGQLLALVVRGGTQQDGLRFVTPPESSLQLGIHQHGAGAAVKPHIHRGGSRTVNDVQEMLHLESGKAEARFYDGDGRQIAITTLSCGDTILLMSGGHGFRFLEPTKMIEVKQGPYLGVHEDKQRFEAVE